MPVIAKNRNKKKSRLDKLKPIKTVKVKTKKKPKGKKA